MNGLIPFRCAEICVETAPVLDIPAQNSFQMPVSGLLPSDVAATGFNQTHHGLFDVSATPFLRPAY